MRRQAHDDLVLAVALACWRTHRSQRLRADDFASGGENVVARALKGMFINNSLELPGWLRY